MANNPKNTDLLVQSPDVIIFRNNTEVYNGQNSTDADVGQIKLQHNAQASFALTKLEVNSNIQTAPNSCSLAFAIDTSVFINAPSPELLQEAGQTQNLNILGITCTAMEWGLMDHIEIFISPNKNDQNYRRYFIGIVTQTTFTINEHTITFNIQAQDLFYWLDNARVATRWSLYDLALRSPEALANDSDIAARLAVFNNQYNGYTLRNIIEKMLYTTDESMINALPEGTAGDYMTILASIGSDPNTSRKLFNTRSMKLEQEIVAARVDKSGSTSQVLRDVNPQLEAKIRSKDIPKSHDLSVTPDEAIAGKLTDFFSVVDAQISQRLNMKNLAQYWEHQFLSIIAENYIPLFRTDDLAALPLVQTDTTQQPLLFEGAYDTRLGLLKQMAELSLYEIYQAPQGYIFVKPPMYNAPPIRTIRAIEIQNMSRIIDHSKILTSATTEGAFVGATGQGNTNTEVPEIQLTNFPFLIGYYEILFPKNFKGLTKNAADATQTVAYKYTISSYKEYENCLDIIKQHKDRYTPDTELYVNLLIPGAISKAAKSASDATKLTTKLSVWDKAGSGDNMTKALTYTYLFSNLEPNKLCNLSAIEPLKDSKVNAAFSDAASYSMFNSYFDSWVIYSKNIGAHKILGISAETLNKVIYACANELRPKFKQVENSTPSTQTTSERIQIISSDRPEIRKKDIVQSFVDNKLWDIVSNILKSPTATTYNVSSPEGDLYKRSMYGLSDTTARKYQIYTLPKLTVRLSGSVTLNTRYLSTGEYNIMEHGYRDHKINNVLVKTGLAASAFSKYFLYINNANVETTTITLKTLRPDIIPGFPILNAMDMNVYYITNVSLSLTPGGDTTTVLTGIARRRPIWYNTDRVSVSDIEGSAQEYLKLLSFADTDKILDSYTISSDESPEQQAVGVRYSDVTSHDIRSANNSVMRFAGWELYGPPEYYPPDDASGEAGTINDSWTFLPPFGAAVTADQRGTDPSGEKLGPAYKGKKTELELMTFYKLKGNQLYVWSSARGDYALDVASSKKDWDSEFGWVPIRPNKTGVSLGSLSGDVLPLSALDTTSPQQVSQWDIDVLKSGKATGTPIMLVLDAKIDTQTKIIDTGIIGGGLKAKAKITSVDYYSPDILAKVLNTYFYKKTSVTAKEVLLSPFLTGIANTTQKALSNTETIKAKAEAVQNMLSNQNNAITKLKAYPSIKLVEIKDV
jgi:hypothetical protein